MQNHSLIRPTNFAARRAGVCVDFAVSLQIGEARRGNRARWVRPAEQCPLSYEHHGLIEPFKSLHWRRR